MSTTNTLNTYFQERTQMNLFSGVVRISRGDTPLYAESFGYANRSWAIDNTLDTRFDTASITKLFTAVAILQLIDRGLLTFETSAVEFLNLEDTTISNAVNIYHLLTHTSGIGDDAEEEAGEDYEALWQTKPNYSVTTTADFLPQFSHKPANFPAGQGCRYCNCSFILLGLMIEKVSGMTYRDYVRKHIFTTAGMAHTDFYHLGRVVDNLAEGYDPIENEYGELVGWKKNIYSFPPIGSPDAGAHVTAADLDRFLRAVKAGKLLSPKLSKAFFTPLETYRHKEGWTQMFGYGMWFYVDDSGTVVCCEKEGINAGVSGLIRHFPRQDINVVILSNMMNGAWEPIWKIHEMILEGKFNA